MARQEINFKRLEEVFTFGSPNTTRPRYMSFDGTYKNIALVSEIPDVSGFATKTEVTEGLATKANVSALAGLAKIVSVTHAELAAAKTAGELVPGYLYLITDYPLADTDPQGDVLVLATAADALATNVWVLPTVAYADPSAGE